MTCMYYLTSYSYHKNQLNGFTLCLYGQRLYSFLGDVQKVTDLRSVLKGKICFFNWKKEVSFLKYIKKTDHCEVI